MFDWDWFDKPEMLSLFLYLLNNAKEKEVKHDGIVEHRGQFLTSLGKLSTIIGAGKQVVRTCLSKLIKNAANRSEYGKIIFHHHYLQL